MERTNSRAIIVGRWVIRGVLASAAFAAVCAAAPDSAPRLVPRPSQLEPGRGAFTLTARTRIAATAGAGRTATLLAGWLAADTGLSLSRAPADQLRGNLVIRKLKPVAQQSEGYRLSVGTAAVEIEAESDAGLVQGCQTLRQLLTQSGQAWMIPGVRIQDKPRFAWRGLMMDCSRTFLSISYLERTIDLMSYFKLNVLHLHLTDDQGWRVEIRKHPKLTSVGSSFAPRYEGERGGYYSQDELQKLVRYAADRGVMIVPEVEMPGHSLAALTAYPELSCTGGPFEIYPFFQGPDVNEDVFCLGNEGTYRLLEDVLDEVASIFPGPYVHIGGDECPRTRWKACPKCQSRIRAEGLADEAALQGYLVKRMGRFLSERHKKVIGWDEIVEGGTAPDATVMFWRSVEGVPALARAGHDIVLSPTRHCYLDYRQSDLSQELGEGSASIPLDKAYSFNPAPATLDSVSIRHVLGAQANMWTHYARTEDAIDRQLFPRLAALAEVFWTPADLRAWSDFRGRLAAQCRRLAKMHVALGINFSHDPAIWADPVRSKQ